jgi:enterochelin esterase family protein
MPLELFTFDSRALAGNLPGDPTAREVWVYLPPDYSSSIERYPVLYALPAFGSTGLQLLSGNRWSPGLGHRLDRLIADGCPPVVAVFPDCFTRWGGSQYVSSPAIGNYEQYVCDELVAEVDRRYRTRAERDARGVFGRSSGGYGAVRLSMRRPDVFGAFACQSGDMGFALCYVPDFAPTIASLKAAGSLEAWVERFESREKKRDFHAINILAMAAAYSPDTSQPFGVRFPFDQETGELIDEVWQRWRDHDPVNMLETAKYADALRSLKLAFFDCGSRDEYRLHLGLGLMRARLEALGIDHVIETFDDNHRSLAYRHDVAIPMLAAALSR